MKKKGNKRKVKVISSVIEREKTIPFNIALANKVLNVIGFVDYIDRTVEWDKEQCQVSPGNLAKAVILATFFDIRAPLSKIPEKFQDIDTEILFGEGILPEHLNDYAIGRTLDKIAKANPEMMFSTICLTAYTIYRIAFKRLHSDTTTISFYGEYEMLETKEEILSIVKGYNKDHRPGCNQVVVGKIVNEHGIPVASSVMDGNTSDVDWNKKAIKLAANIFGKELEQGIYIADSKLINKEMVKTMMNPQKKVRFISRCPANFNNKLEEKIIEKAYKDDKWQDLGKFGGGKKACDYKGQEYIENIEGYNIRLLAVETSAGIERFKKKKMKALDALEDAIKKVNKKEFACKADAEKEWERFQKQHKNSIYLYTVEFREIKHEKRRRGNPGKNPKPPVIEIKWTITVKIEGENKPLMTKFEHKEKCFVLITNVESQESDMQQILGYYKNQMVVETDFRFFKEPCLASVIYLKTPERIRALIMLLSVSLLIRALVQYKMRKGIKGQHFIRERTYQYSYTFSNSYKQLQVTTLLKLMNMTVEDLLE